MEYLVTGGGGFIGSNICRKLVSQGREVRIIDNFSTGRRSNLEDLDGKVDLIEGDIRDTGILREAMRGVRYVLHLGALPSVPRSVEDPVTSNEVNVTGTLNVLVAARDAGVERFVFSSSSSVYGNTEVLPKREDMAPRPMSPYAVQKLCAEKYTVIFHKLYGLKTFALRYFNVFGPYQNPESQYAAVVPKFVTACRSGKSPIIHGDGGQTRDFTFVDDVAAANLACCSCPESGAGAAYNIARGERISVIQLYDKIAQQTGFSGRPQHVESRAGDVRDSLADISAAVSCLGWRPSVSFEEGLSRTVKYFSSEQR